MRAVVVTGVSSGIGEAIARVLIEKGIHVFGSVRKEVDAERLRKQFGDRLTPLIFDVTDEAAVRRAAQQVRATLGSEKLFGLVNNAGVAVPGPLLHLKIEEFRRQVDVNLAGPLIATQAFAPLLGVDRSLSGAPGRIINMSSVAGRFAYPFLGAYVASKHALEGLSDTLRRELILYGIDVIIVGPGSVATPIWDKAEAEDLGPYSTTDYAPVLEKVRAFMLKRGRRGYPPQKVGEVVFKALTAARPSARYVVVPRRFVNWTVPMILPKRLVDRMLARQLGWR
jgi:NAD(P)-dependent dehydrogenase (short-subunit alcohol dehydrogenase family)